MIFHIGLNKTGSTSLHYALQILRYNSSHGSEAIKEQVLFNIGKGIDPLSNIDSSIEAFTDNNAINQNFEYIFRYYPKACYIYTPRNTEDWLHSRAQHVIENQQNPNYEGGFLTVDKAVWKELKAEHERKIVWWIQQNDVKYLELPICDGENLWQKLCTFLDKDMPREPFPHKNKTL